MFAPGNNILQAENSDLSTGMTLVAACVENAHNLRTEEKFCDVWDEVVTQSDAHLRQTRRDNILLLDYVVEKIIKNNEMNKDAMWKLFHYLCGDYWHQVINEIKVRFSH